jgi:hypothetical protein
MIGLTLSFVLTLSSRFLRGLEMFLGGLFIVLRELTGILASARMVSIVAVSTPSLRFSRADH